MEIKGQFMRTFPANLRRALPHMGADGVKRAAGAGVIAALALLCASGTAFAADDALPRAATLLKAGYAQDAYVLLNAGAVERADDPEYDYVLGLAAIDSGHLPEAILALQRTLAIKPDDAQARAEIARAYALLGDVNTARREFSLVAGDPTIPDPVRQRFKGLVRGLDKVNTPGLSVAGYIEAGAGYDSNINAATSASQLVIPLLAALGPATLSGNAQRQGDGFGLFEGGLSAEYGFDRQSKLFASVLGSGHANFNHGDFDQALAVGTIGIAHTLLSHDVISLSAQTQRFWIGGKSYRSAGGGIAQFTHVLGPSRALAFSGQVFDIRYQTDPLRNAKRYSGMLTYSDGGYSASLSGGTERTNAAASDYLSNDYIGARLAAEHQISQRTVLFASTAVERRQYNAPDVLFLVDRRDTQFDAAAGLRYRLSKRFVLTPQVGYTHNASNIALNRYDRVTTSLSLRVEF